MIRKLLEDPGRYGFFQAVRLVERTLAQNGFGADVMRSRHLCFTNSNSLAFAAGEVERITADNEASPKSAHELVSSLRDGSLRQIRVAPTFIGLLGIHGTLPLHYTEAIHTAAGQAMSEERLAFLDTLSSRLVALFYGAWKAQRFELAHDDDDSSLKSGLLALASAFKHERSHAGFRSLEAYYCGLLRHRPVSAVALEQVLTRHFDMQVEVVSGLPTRHPIPPDFQASLRSSTMNRNAPCVLGSHMHRRDIRCAISLHPLSRKRALEFVRSGPGAAELTAVLALFAVSTTEFDVRVVLSKEQVVGARLNGARALGYDSYVLTQPDAHDRPDMHYLLRTM